MNDAVLQLQHVDVDNQHWQHLLEQSEAPLFVKPSWCRVLSETYGFPIRVAIAFRDGVACCGVPYAEIENFRGLRRISLPATDVCEPVGNDWGMLESLLRADGVPFQIKGDIRVGQPSSVLFPAVQQLLNVEAGNAAVVARFAPKLRRNIKHFASLGGACEVVRDASALESFYDLFSRLHKERFRRLPYGIEFFAHIVREFFPRNGAFLVAKLDGQPVAQMLVLWDNEVMHMPYVASDQSALSARPNDYVYGELVKFAIETGCKSVDLGLSSTAGLIGFKAALGATLRRHCSVRYNFGDEATSMADLEDRMWALSRLLTDESVPLRITQEAGGLLYPLFE